MTEGSVSAVIITIGGNWHAVFDLNGRTHRLPIRSDDAWTFDVENGLEVKIRLEDGRVRVEGRRGKNRYVSVEDRGVRL